MEPSLIILHFPVSRSKFYPKAINLAKKFDKFENGKENVVSMTMTESFEKWEYFNLLFWTIVDWSGMVLEYEGFRYQAHYDKTQIFYALQLAKDKHRAYVMDRIGQMPRVLKGEIKIEDINDIIYSEKDMNDFLDYYLIAKNKINGK